jgi:hypothetical protein
MSRSDAVELCLDYRGEESPKAWKAYDGDGKAHWLPKSQCTMDGDPKGTIFLVPEWLAKNNGLI